MSARQASGSMPVSMLDLKAQHRAIRAELDEAVARALDSGNFILGPVVEKLEHEIAALCGCRYAIGVSSGTDALLACLMAEGIGPGDEVVVPDYGFFATAGVVARVGATPVFVDVDPRTYAIDARSVEAAITPRTRVVIPVHLFGQAADMDALLDLAASRGLVVLEDAAQAIGATYRERPVGSMGTYGALSFFPSKNLGGIGDGGMVVTNDAERAERLRALRVHGALKRHHHELVGGNFRLDAIQAAVLLVKLRHLERWTQARRENAASYRRLLGSAEASGKLVLPEELPDRTHTYNQFVVRCEARDEVRAKLAAQGIATEVYYPVPLHAQPCFSHLLSATRAFPNASRLAATSVALPVHPELGAGDVERVAREIGEAVK